MKNGLYSHKQPIWVISWKSKADGWLLLTEPSTRDQCLDWLTEHRQQNDRYRLRRMS